MPVADHIDNAVRTVTFNPVASVGPFALPWPLYAAADANELKSDFLITLAGVVQTNFTVAGTFINGVAIDGSVTFGSAITGALIIYSRRRPRSSADFVDGQALTSLELQGVYNAILASQRDIYDWLTKLEAGNVLPAGTFVPTAGGVMSGFLDLNADPTTALKAATKQYVDGKLTSTTKGDLIGYTGAASARIPVGSNGKRLVADSAQSTGLAYARNGGTLQTLTDAASIAWDMSLGDDAKVTITANRTLSASSGEVVGQTGYLDVIQDGTGNRTLTWNAEYSFPNLADEKPDRTASSTTRYKYWVRGVGDVVIKKLWSSASNSIGFYKEYALANPYALSQTITQAHGLGRHPALVTAYVECKTAELGWAIGDRIEITALIDGAAGNTRPIIGANITNAYIVIPSTLPNINNFTTFAQATIVAANWRIYLRVYE